MSALRPRHAAREPLAVRVAAPVGVLFAAAWSLVTLCAPLAETRADALPHRAPELPVPAAVMTLPEVAVAESVASNPCGDDSVQTAMAAGDDAATVRAFGGGEEFRAAVVAGNAPCVGLDDPSRTWVVVNKHRPLQPESFAPASLSAISLRATTASDELRPEAARALEQMAEHADAAGAGVLGINNGYRSYNLQQHTYGAHVRERGQAGADAVSARPGFSEHQSGLAFDLVACSPRCGDFENFGSTAQGQWVAQNAWKHGFIVRYEPGETGTTGYAPEPWHIRYIGVELAAAYHDGGYHSLEQFFGLPAAPDYAH